MKQKIVIKVQMESDRSRSKALKLMAAASGVHSVAIAGADRDQVVVVGERVDAIALLAGLRRKIGSAEVVQVSAEDSSTRRIQARGVARHLSPRVEVSSDFTSPESESLPRGPRVTQSQARPFVKQIKLIRTLVADTCTDIAIHFTPADQIEEQQKRCADYSLKALGFAITTFIAYRVAAPSASSTSATFKIAMAAFFLAVATDLVSVARPPKWGSLLTYLSWFLLVLVSYLLLISFNKVYGYAIFPVLIPIVIVLRQLKLGHGAWQRFNMGDQQAVGAPNTDIEAGQDVNTDDGALNTSDKTDKDLDGIFNLSAGIVNFGGFINMILGYYMSGSNKPRAVNAAGFFFFFTIVLGLYLMMATSVRTVELARHARLLSYLLMFLLLSTFFATGGTTWGPNRAPPPPPTS